jgi:hypothetical protein
MSPVIQRIPIRYFVIAAVYLPAWFGSSCRAGEVLDQQNVISSAIADSAGTSSEVGQTFTVGVTGKLTRIDVPLAPAGFTSDNAVLTVYNTTAGLPNAALGNASVNPSLVSTTTPTFVSFDLPGIAISLPAMVDRSCFQRNEAIHCSIGSRWPQSCELGFPLTMLARKSLRFAGLSRIMPALFRLLWPRPRLTPPARSQPPGPFGLWSVILW